MNKTLLIVLSLLTLASSCARADAIDYSKPESVPVLKNYDVTWMANTFGQSGRRDGKWVQNQIFAMHVMPDSTIYANSPWDEGGRECGIYKDGQVIGKLADTHSVLAGFAITSDGKYIYAGIKSGFVRRYHPDGKTAPFKGGKRGGMDLPVGGESKGPVGLAIIGQELFVATKSPDFIKVYRTSDLSEVRSWAIQGTGPIVADQHGSIWSIQRPDNAPAKIMRYKPDGTAMPQVISDVEQPSAIAMDSRGRLMVAENGPDQQVRFYDIAGEPKLVDTLGQKGGVFAEARGQMGPLRFYGITALGSDAAGNIYVNSNGWDWSGTDLRAFSPEGKMLWQLQGLTFVDLVDANPAELSEVYGVQERFTVDYDAPAGKGWTHADYTLDPFANPHDPRVNGAKGSAVRMLNIQGRKFMAIHDMDGTFAWLYRFEGRIAVPAVGFAAMGDRLKVPTRPNAPRWFWRDANGDGRFDADEFTVLGEKRDGISGLFDSRGDYWQPIWGEEIRHYPLKGIDERGVPIYDPEPAAVIDCPADFNDMERIEYIPETDTMYISGYTPEWPSEDKYFIPAGRAIAAYPEWSKGNRKAKWIAQLPYVAKGNRIAKAMSIAGDYVFVNYFGVENIVVIDNRTGTIVGRMIPTAVINNEHGDADFPWAVKAIKRPNGQYIIFVEDDRYAKVVIYRWTPQNR